MIHVIGNAAVDSVIRVDRFPRPGETIVALGASEDLGGKGANQAIAAARCGAQVRLVAAIGDDAQGERIRSKSRRRRRADGRPGDLVIRRPTAASLRSTRRGENTILSLIDAARNFDPIAETPSRVGSGRATGSSCRAISRPNVTRDCLALAKSKGATTALNPSPTYPAHGLRLDASSISSSSTAARRSNLRAANASDAASALCEKGAGAVVLTLGAEGAAFFSADDAFRVAAPEVVAIDAVGAGDVFCGVLIAAKVVGLRLERSARRRRPRRLRLRSRERASSLPFRPGRRWRTFLSAPRSDVSRSIGNDRHALPSRERGRTRCKPYSAARAAC